MSKPKSYRTQDGCWNCRWDYELHLDLRNCQYGVDPQRDDQKDWNWHNEGLRGFLDSSKVIDAHVKKCAAVSGHGICDHYQKRKETP